MQRRCARSLNELSEIVAMTRQLFDDHDIDESKHYVVDLCIEELFVNMVTYDTETEEEILIEMEPHEAGVRVSLTDFTGLISDGVYEYMDTEGSEFGEQRVADVIAAGQDLSMADLSRRLVAAAIEFGGEAPQADDVTLVLVRRLPA